MKIIKKALFLCATVGLSAFTFGQVEKPEAGTFGATAGLSAIAGNLTTDASSTGSLLLRYYISDRIVARGAVNVQTLSNAANTVTDTTTFSPVQGLPNPGDGVTTRTNEVSGMLYNVELGAQYNIGNIDNLEVFFGASAIIGIDGNRNTYHKREWVIDGFGRTAGDYDESTLTTPVRTRFGARFMLGTNYFITPNIAIGAEFGYAFQTVVRSGGEISESSLVNGETSQNTINLDGFSETRNELGTTGALLTLSFFF